jgi:hypothetical protein
MEKSEDVLERLVGSLLQLVEFLASLCGSRKDSEHE